MRLPDDFEERNKMTPTILTTGIMVFLFVGVILLTVWFLNQQKEKEPEKKIVEESQVIIEESQTYPEADELISGSKLSPDDLDFWDKYPEKTPEPVESVEESEAVENIEDPATDGKHTLLTYKDKSTEWVLISPYLPKHDYDFTRLVCQSELMKYYDNGKQISFVGIDISKFQEHVDFDRVKRAGIDFVMLRAGFRGYGSGQLVVDEYFMDNIKRATDAGLQIGIYFFSQAITKEEAVEEANFVLQLIEDYDVKYPIAYDMEIIENDSCRVENLSRTERTDITKAFLDTVRDAGYEAMVYGEKEWFIKQLDLSKLTAYDFWLAQPGDIPDYPYKFSMWQYSQNAIVDGINGYVDMDICFIDYSEK